MERYVFPDNVRRRLSSSAVSKRNSPTRESQEEAEKFKALLPQLSAAGSQSHSNVSSRFQSALLSSQFSTPIETSTPRAIPRPLAIPQLGELVQKAELADALAKAFPTAPKPSRPTSPVGEVDEPYNYAMSPVFAGTGVRYATGKVIEVDLWRTPTASAMYRFHSACLNDDALRKPNTVYNKAHVELGQVLGTGATAVVYLGRVIETGETIAVKHMTANQRARKEDFEATWAELETLRDLCHPNIIRFRGLHFNESEGELSLLLECVPTSLQTLIAQRGVGNPYDEPEAANLTRQILRGLNYLHSRKIIHRDLKPANILITLNGEVKITDFGASAHLSNIAQHRQAVGTPYYTAPEVMSLEPYSCSADIWSLGACLLEIISSQRPYHDLNEMAAMFAIQEDPHPPIPSSVSEDCRDFLLQCWRKHPEERPSARELLLHPFIIMAADTFHTSSTFSSYQSMPSVMTSSMTSNQTSAMPSAAASPHLSKLRLNLPTAPTPENEAMLEKLLEFSLGVARKPAKASSTPPSSASTRTVGVGTDNALFCAPRFHSTALSQEIPSVKISTEPTVSSTSLLDTQQSCTKPDTAMTGTQTDRRVFFNGSVNSGAPVDEPRQNCKSERQQ